MSDDPGYHFKAGKIIVMQEEVSPDPDFGSKL